MEKIRVVSGKIEVRDSSGKLVNMISILDPTKPSECASTLRLNYVLKRIFENLEFKTEQITSNALNMASLFKSVQGYSGTIDNINVLPPHLVSQAYEERLKNEKNNGAIASKLLEQGPNTVSIAQITSTMTISDIFEEMFKEVAEKENFNAIIDVGALFKSFRNFEVARAALKILKHVDVATFYDETSNNYIT